MDEAGHKTGPADIFVPRESERHVGREVDERGLEQAAQCIKQLDRHLTSFSSRFMSAKPAPVLMGFAV